MSDDTLELSAVAPDRPKARIRTDRDPEGTLYERAVPEDFGLLPFRELTLLLTEMDDLWERSELNKAQERRLETVTNTLTSRLIPDAPMEDVEAIPAVAKRALIMDFFVKSGMSVERSMSPETLARLSPDSNGSTEGDRASGSG